MPGDRTSLIQAVARRGLKAERDATDVESWDCAGARDSGPFGMGDGGAGSQRFEPEFMQIAASYTGKDDLDLDQNHDGLRSDTTLGWRRTKTAVP